MSLLEFEEILMKNNVNDHDLVIINGGEPTIHRDFWRVLDAIKNRKAKIDLFTNGKLLSNFEFIQNLLSYKNIHIRVPLFGSTPKSHDRLTGMSGNFISTTQGLDLLCQYIHKGMSLEIKLLLSKATVSENEKIYDMITSRWLNESVRISLNPLLISKCVIQKKDIMMDTYENLMIESEPLIRKALADGINFSMALIPYCSFPNQDLIEKCCAHSCGGNMFYAAPGCTTTLDHLSQRKYCHKCRYINKCNGFPENYVSYYGENVMKPFTD
jgi:organic radical activating enzyme